MPATFIADTIEGSQVELFGQATSAVRTGVVYGLPTTGDPEAALWAAMTATDMPATGSLYPGLANCFLTRIQVFGVSADMARVKLIYEPFQGVVNTVLLINIDTTLSTFATNMMPGTKKPFKVNYTPSDSKLEKIPDDLLTIQMLRPMQRVSVMQLRGGTLDTMTAAAMADNVGKVNLGYWLGKPQGAWIISGAQASISRYGGYYQTRLEALRQGNDLWRYFGILRSQMTGKYAIDSVTESVINTLKGSAYSPMSFGTANGVGMIEPYEAIQFTPLFGF